LRVEEQVPAIRAVSHVAIGVRDMATAVPFYRDFLGMRVVNDREERFVNPAGSEVSRRAVYLRWDDTDDSQFVVLDQRLGEPADGKPAALFSMGLHHVGFWVDDVRSFVENASRFGGRVVAPAVETGSASYGLPEGGRVLTVYLRDPDGNVVQLDQRLV
jgi:catechol 2,3-dioxygenase-like lactoylglutathione lyase family enzyme